MMILKHTLTRSRILILTSILVSVATIVALILINAEIANYYQRVDGKSRLWFGLLEYLNYGYKYYLILGGIIAIALAGFALFKSKAKTGPVLALSLGIIAIVLVFVRIWTFMLN